MQDKKEKGRRNVRWLRHANSLNSLKGISPMNFPADVKYTKDHEWIRISGDTGIVGITDYAQGELGDVVFLELPAVGKMEVNADVAATPEVVNKDPYGKGWLVKVKLSNPAEAASLLDAAGYKALIGK
jgi:glycine cleavage system H protein